MVINFALEQASSYEVQIPQEDFFSLLSQNKERFIFIKNDVSVYQYANPLFLELMGIRSIKHLSDCDLCRDPKKVKIYQEHDSEVLETEKALQVIEEILPQKNELIRKQMGGKIYPIYSGASKPIAIMGVVQPCHQPFHLTIETAVGLTKEDMDANFIRRSYQVLVYNNRITLSKRELQCIIELIKGKTAGEIATTLALKQTTIEFYIENIKDKLGATSKSSLIMTIFNQKIIQQIVL